MQVRATVLFSTLLLLVFAGPAWPQADVSTAVLKGTVTDETGAVIAGATLTARDIERGITRQATTDSEGVYQIRLLQPGAYELRVEAAGFRAQVLSDITLTVGQIGIVDIRLKVGAVTEEISVGATASMVETERSQQANTIQESQIENLPNVGRNFTAYVFTLPGVSSSTAPRAQFPGFTFASSGFSIGGSNGRNNLITVDGGENEYGSGQLRVETLSVEAVQEFQVNRNAFAAEFGFTAGTAVNLVTKSGTNDLHGSAYTYYRSQKTSARYFFDTNSKKAFDQQVYPGVTLGGPVVRNKLFFFTSYEALKSDAARFRHYTDNAGILGATASQSGYLAQLDAASDPNIRRIGAALRPALGTANYPATMKLLTQDEGTFNAPGRVHTWVSRMDYQMSTRDSLSGRFSLVHSDTDQLGVANGIAPSNTTNLYVRDYTALFTWTHNLSASVINQVRAQFVPHNSARTLSKAPDGTSLVISGVATFGRTYTAPFNTFQDRYQFEDTLSWAKGKHFFKFGGSSRPVHYRVINALWFGGEWTFSTGFYPLVQAVPSADRTALVAFNRSIGMPDNGPAAANLSALQSFNLGLPFTYRQSFNNPEWQDWAHFIGAFAQDSWKATPRLTIDAGVRLDYDREPTPLHHYTFASPRLGLAWDPFGDQKTVIRAGGGIFVSPVYYQVGYLTNLLDDSGRYLNQIFKTPASGAQAPPLLWAAGVAAGKLPFKAVDENDLHALGVATGRGNPGRVVFGANPDYKNNYTVQASLGISRQIMKDLSLEVAYQLYRGVHIQTPWETNYRENGQFIPGFGPQLVAIDPTITQNNTYSSIGNSMYHGLTVSLAKRYTRNVQFQANYTFSKTIDDVTDFNSAFAASLPTRLNLERGLSAFDIRHNFVASGVFRSPFQAGAGHNFLARAFADITLSPIVFLRSGIPFSLRAGRDLNGDSHSTYDRPYPIGRNTGFGENFYSTNLRLSKQFFVKRDSGLRAEFIAEASNLFNRTSFLSLNDVIGGDPKFPFGPFRLQGDRNLPPTAPYGFTSAGDARRVQFGLKLAF